jgi:hypothetical protein
LSKIFYGEEGCDLHGLWLVILESAKNRVLVVDTPGQQVLPCVRYGMALSHLVLRSKLNALLYVCRDQFLHIERQIVK